MDIETMKFYFRCKCDLYFKLVSDERLDIGSRIDFYKRCKAVIDFAFHLSLVSFEDSLDLFAELDKALYHKENEPEKFIYPELDASLPFSEAEEVELQSEPEDEVPFTFDDIRKAVTPSEKDYEKFADDIPELDTSPKLGSYGSKTLFLRYVQHLIRRHNCYVVSKHAAPIKVGDSFSGLMKFLGEAVAYGFINDREFNLLEDMILVER